MLRKAHIAIDASNFKYYLWEQGWWIDWNRFLDYFRRRYEIVNLIYYEGLRSKATYFDYKPDDTLEDFLEAKRKKLKFFDYLKSIGFKVVTKLLSRVYDHTEGKMKHKGNFDVEITINALHHLNGYDEFILCSGDGDFTALIRYLKGHKKKTVIVSPKWRYSHILAKTSNRLLFLEDLKRYIEIQ